MSNRLMILAVLSLLLFSFTFQNELVLGLNQTNQYVLQGLASVGVYSSVEPNEFSRLAQQLREKEEELAEREAAIVAAEAQEGPLIPIEWYVTALAFILLILVLLNFYLDWRREEQTA